MTGWLKTKTNFSAEAVRLVFSEVWLISQNTARTFMLLSVCLVCRQEKKMLGHFSSCRMHACLPTCVCSMGQNLLYYKPGFCSFGGWHYILRNWTSQPILCGYYSAKYWYPSDMTVIVQNVAWCTCGWSRFNIIFELLTGYIIEWNKTIALTWFFVAHPRTYLVGPDKTD